MKKIVSIRDHAQKKLPEPTTCKESRDELTAMVRDVAPVSKPDAAADPGQPELGTLGDVTIE